jgi:hypothetical protein
LNIQDTGVELTMLAGVIGQAAAFEFINWRNMLDLPTAEECLFGNASVEARADLLTVVCGSVTRYLENDYSERNYDAVLDFFNRLRNETGQGAIIAQDATKLLKKQPAGYDRAKFVEKMQPWVGLLKDSGMLEMYKAERKKVLANR